MFLSHLICFAFGLKIAIFFLDSQNVVTIKDTLLNMPIELQDLYAYKNFHKINNGGSDVFGKKNMEDISLDKNITFGFPESSIIYLVI